MLGPATLSTLKASSLGLLRSTSSVGVSGDIGIAVSVMSRSWSATAFRGLSPPGEGPGLPRAAGGAGIDIGAGAGRSARAVLSKGIGGGWSRLRLGEGCARCVGISPVDGSQSYMDTAERCGQDVDMGGFRGKGRVVLMALALFLCLLGRVPNAI